MTMNGSKEEPCSSSSQPTPKFSRSRTAPIKKKKRAQQQQQPTRRRFRPAPETAAAMSDLEI
jgi:hypothetical protein